MENANKITFYNILSTVILQGLTFFTSPIISRMLGTNNYGIVSVYITWVSVIATVFGLQTQSTIAVSRREFPNDQRRYQSSILTLSIMSFLGLSLISLVFIKPLSSFFGLSAAVVPIMLAHGFGHFCITFFNTKFTYEFKAKWNFALTMIITVSTLSLSIILIYLVDSDVNYWGRIMGLAIPYILIGIGLCCVCLFRGKCYYNKEFWTFCLPLSLPIIFHSVSTLLLNQSDRVMLQQLLDNSSVGIYSLACTFAAVLSTIWSALNNSWVPFYYEYSRQGNIEVMTKRARNYLELFTVLASGFVLLANEVYHLFASKEYWDGTILVTILAIGYYFVFLYSFPVNYEFYNKKTRATATGTLLAAICNIILNFLFIKFWGIVGAAVATAVAHGLQFIFHHIVANRLVKTDAKYPFSLKMLFPFLFMFMLFAFLSIVIQNAWYIRWIVGGIIGIWELVRMYKRKAIF